VRTRAVQSDVRVLTTIVRRPRRSLFTLPTPTVPLSTLAFQPARLSPAFLRPTPSTRKRQSMIAEKRKKPRQAGRRKEMQR